MSTKRDFEYELTGELSEDMSIILTSATSLRRILYHFLGEKLLIKISIFRPKRSDKQNRYMWGVIVPCVRAWLFETQGIKYTKDQAYAWINQEVLGNKPVIVDIMGVEVITLEGKRFSQMSTKEFAEAVDTIIVYFDPKGCRIPLPKENNLITDHIDDN